MNSQAGPSSVGVGEDHDPFSAGEVSRVVPTTEAQREVWLADQLGPEASLAYNESITLHFEGVLDRPALDQALAGLAERHEALRTTFGPDGLHAWVADRIDLPAPLIDLGGLDAEARDRGLAEARARAVETRFDLARGPLVRAELLRLAPDRHDLVLTAHHIVCDGWSMGVLVTELMALYRAHASGQPATLAPAPRFGDYALGLSSPDAVRQQAADERYWVQSYDASIPTLDLPLDRARSASRRSVASRREDLELGDDLAKAVQRFGAQQGASLFATLFTVFAALMSRLSGADEVVVGVPAAGQATAGLPGLVGHCVNLLPVRVPVGMDAPMASLVAQARTLVLDAYEHQACTFGSVLKKLKVERDPTRLPLVSVMFNLDAPLNVRALSDEALRVRVASNPRHFETFELFLNITPTDTGLRLECQYHTGLFDGATVRRWLELYRAALERCAADPALEVAGALAPTDAERALFDRFNATDFEYDRSVRVDTLIARRAALSPDAVAVTADGRHLSYRALDARATTLALALRDRGIGPGDLVGIACGRNEHMLVSIVGVLRSGAGYVPLDPDLPPQRLAFMASDAALRCVVSDASVTGAWPFGDAERLAVDDLPPDARPCPPLGGVDDVCYTIFTSGSTGTPKGVRVPHRTVVNLLNSLRAAPRMDAGSQVLSVTTLSFDIAVSELIAPLVAGARIVVADKHQAMDGERLRELIEREGVNFIDGTPSTYRLLVASGWRGRADLVAICIGEPLPPDLARRLVPMIGELWNAYGPTETTVWSTMQRVEHVDGPVPIGRPIENTQIHIVDSRLRRLPLGVVGEIYIAGEGVTLGYLNRPELTAERFAEPPADAPRVARPTRWYQTGDLGRWRADGILECLGRIDHQVKVRGYRIELGEIETAILRHPGVARVAVVTREDLPGDVRIVAYLVPAAGAAVDHGALRRQLGETLPGYMVPQHFVNLERLPELHNGKLNRHALPAPGAPRAAAAVERVAPRSDTERQVLAAMEEVLDLPGLSVLDNFFTLGGHSLLAMRLTARLNQAFGVQLPLRTLFEASTVEAYAAAIDAARAQSAPRREAIRREAPRAATPLSTAQERIRFLEEVNPGQVLFNTPSAHRLTGPLDTAVFERALREIVRRQAVLRTRIARAAEGPGHVQEVLDEIEFELPFEDLSGLPRADREATAMARMQAIVDRPIELGRAPLFRAALYRLADDEHLFMFMVHHIVWDGWSFDILYDEMAAIYGALAAGAPIPLPPPAISYADYCRWLADWRQGPEAAQQLAYWKARFAHAAPPKAPVTDLPRHAGASGRGATLTVRIDRALADRLHETARAHGVTLNMLTMAVYAALLAGAVDSPSVVLGLPVRGRMAPEAEGVMGYFVNMLPVPFEVDPAQPLGGYLAAIRQEVVGALDHQEIPFVDLVSEPGLAGRARSVGLYQAVFSFQDARERNRQWGALKQENVPLFHKGATEDLGLWLMEGPGGLEGGFTYNADLYLPATAEAFHQRYLEMLRHVAAERDPRVADLLEVGASPAGQWIRRLAGAPATGDAGPAPAPAATAASRPATGFATDGERALAMIWADVLGIDLAQISPDDNFFDLGGHSLLAMRVVESSQPLYAERVDARRYFVESLRQLAHGAAPGRAAPGPDTGAVPAEAQAPRGFLKRMFGRLGGKDAR